jgi:glycosyltransferase involved in cell wall biosynthesis
MSDSSLRIVSLTCVYPTKVDPGHGLFVQRRMKHVASLAEVRIVAPLAAVDYGHPERRLFELAKEPYRVQDGPLAVYHPKWFYPPGGGWTNGYWLAARLWPLMRRMRAEFPFDVIDAHHAHPVGVAAALLARRFGVPFTVTLRGNESKFAETPAIRRAMSRALAQAGRAIGVSENLRELAVSLGADPRRARTIPNGVDSGIFYPRDRAQARRKLGLPEGVPLVVTAGSLCERKGHHRVVEALRAVTGAHLAIAGSAAREGNYEPRIRAAVEAAGMGGRVTFLGHCSAPLLAEAMSAADVFCLASRQEGWPNVVHEAMACGAPVVATEVGGLRDMLEGGTRGEIVAFGDEAGLRDALERALRRDWDRAGITAWAHARSWAQVAAEVVREMRELTEESRK